MSIWQLTCYCHYAAFLHYDELVKLCCCDVKFSTDSMAVYVQSSKTDQYWQGDMVHVARTGSCICMMERYLKMSSLSQSSTLSFVQGTKQHQRLCASGSLSYTRMRELFLAKLQESGFEVSHNLRLLETDIRAS